MEWSEGVEDYRNKTMDNLWAILGFQNKRIPCLSLIQDPDGIHDPWNEEDQVWFRDPANTVPFNPRWHQLVSIVKLLECAFRGLPVFLMDDVGLGKTLQVTSLIATLAYYCEYHKEHSCFPGAFGECQSLFNLYHPDSYLSEQVVERMTRKYLRCSSRTCRSCCSYIPDHPGVSPILGLWRFRHSPLLRHLDKSEKSGGQTHYRHDTLCELLVPM
jgi:hypothetical protein